MNFLFIGSFLWLRKVLIFFLLLILLLAFIVYWVAHSPLVIDKIATRFAPDYNISYTRIYGNAITGLEIDDLAYNNTPLAKHITLRWNPNTLIHKEISLNKVILEEVHVDTVKSLIASFKSKESNETNTSKEPLAFAISLDYLSIKLASFVEENITISSTNFILEEAFYKDNSLYSDSISLNLDIQKYVDKIKIEHIGLRLNKLDLDTKALIIEDANLSISLISNISKVSYDAKVKKNLLNGQIKIDTQKKLYELYHLPIRNNALKTLKIDLNASENFVSAQFYTKIPQLLKAKKGEFNIDIQSLESLLIYNIKKGRLKVNSKVLLDTPYSKNIRIKNILTMDEEIEYHGNIFLKSLTGIDNNFTQILDDLKITYKGDLDSIDSTIVSNYLNGSFVSKDFKHGELKIETTKAIALKEMIDLPSELNQSKVHIAIYAPLSFESNSTLRANAKIVSNLMNIDSNISYKKHLKLDSIINVPKDSLFKAYSKEVQWNALDKISLKATMTDKEAKAILSAKKLSIDTRYDFNSTYLEGKVILGSLHSSVQGKMKDEMNITTNISSIPKAIKSLSSLYHLQDISRIKGSVNSNITIKKMKEIDISLSSPSIDSIKDIKINASISKLKDSIKLLLNSYEASYEEQKIFATKLSSLKLKDEQLLIEGLWINDELKIEGNYSLEALQGEISAYGEKTHLLLPKFIDLKSDIDVKTSLDANHTDISGKVTLIKGEILYDLAQKTFASDSDIVMIKKHKKIKPNTFMDRLSLNINFNTQEPLKFQRDNINIKSHVSLSIQKVVNSNIMLLGSIELLKGGSYRFRKKKFTLKQSFIYFTGDMNKPLINISVGYKAINHKITIAITGMPTSPHIEFTSVPSLTKEQILSIILFDSEGGAGTNSAEDMMKMMGGVMAKSALSNLGIQVDSLVFGEGDSIEIGKKLTNKITIIYVNDIVSKVKLNYEHGRHTQSVIGASEESQSYDIVYKRDF